MPLPRPALAILRRQDALITRAQLVGLDVPRSTIDTWVDRGVLERLHRGIYRQPGVPATGEQRLRAALLRCGDDARIGGWSACALYRIEGLDLRRRPWVVVPPERRVRGVAFMVQRAHVARGDRAVVGGLPTVAPARALIDAAAKIDARARRVAIDDAHRRTLIDLERLLDRAVELGRHRGAVAVRRLFTSGLLDQDGELERQLALLLHEAGLRPAWGMEVLPGIVVDACFPQASYVIECDGRRWHTIDADRAADVTRQGVLEADGWHVDRVRHEDLVDDRVAVLARVRATHAARIAAGLGRPGGWQPVRAGRRVRPPTADTGGRRRGTATVSPGTGRMDT